jgi:hypothetical protein
VDLLKTDDNSSSQFRPDMEVNDFMGPAEDHRRTPRNVKKPVSYQEPSLAAKVRKGFKFFKFET